jgi:hypothetical protein
MNEETLKQLQQQIYNIVQQSYSGKTKFKNGQIILLNDKLNKSTDLNYKLRNKLNQ